MTMRINRLAEAEAFSPAGHAGVGPLRLQGGVDSPTERMTVVLSHYLPGGQAEMSPQPVETSYVLVSGELVMTSENQEATLRPYDSVHFTPGTVRQVVNRSQLPASMLVIRPVAP